jgi:tight adherence protein B
MDIRSVLIVILTVSSLAGFFYILVFPLLSGEAKAEKRHARIMAKSSSAARGTDRSTDAAARRKQISESLKELERRNAEKKKTSLEDRIAQAGYSLTKPQFFMASGAAALVTSLLLFVMSHSALMAAAAGPIIGGLGLPNFWLSHMTKKRLRKFELEFPGAIDVIIRGVKAGLPLGDCLRIIASESPEPVRSEFRAIIETQTIGLSTAEAVERMTSRIPTPEANFFAIVIAIQQKAGGNLAEALTNLARVLRERKKMRDKIKAVSSEAKASASIIGSLPVAVAFLVYLTSPHYIELLWTTQTGRITLVVCGIVMAIGVFIMKKMIAFDI